MINQGKTRTIKIDIPSNYDNTKPYHVVFDMHCMGGWAQGVVNGGYYGLKPLDIESSTIFVAPQGYVWDSNSMVTARLSFLRFSFSKPRKQPLHWLFTGVLYWI